MRSYTNKGVLMKKLYFFWVFIFCKTVVNGLITHTTVLTEPPGKPKQLIFVCGDRHNLGSWKDNVEQFLNLALLPNETKLKTLFLVENLSTSNEYFNRPQDLLVLREKEAYVLENLINNYLQETPIEIPTHLHLWGCSQDFFRQLCSFLTLPEKTSMFLSKLGVINIDNRHRNIYYGESLCGWNYGPYNYLEFKKIQESEAKQLTLSDLLIAQNSLKKYIAQSSGTLQSIFNRIFDRQESLRLNLFEELSRRFSINKSDMLNIPISQIAGDRSQAMYKYLKHSPLEYILHEMIEANALWHITQRTSDITIVLAGGNHSGHMQGKTPGLTSYLAELGYTAVITRGPSQETLQSDRQAAAKQAINMIPKVIKNHIKRFLKQPQ